MSRSFGVPNAYGSLKRVLMHRPGPELDVVTPATAAEFNFERQVDRRRFQDDYDAMLQRFCAHGVDVVMLGEVLSDDDDAMRFIADITNPEWVEYQKRRIGSAIDAGVDGFFFDNTSSPLWNSTFS